MFAVPHYGSRRLLYEEDGAEIVAKLLATRLDSLRKRTLRRPPKAAAAAATGKDTMFAPPPFGTRELQESEASHGSSSSHSASAEEKFIIKRWRASIAAEPPDLLATARHKSFVLALGPPFALWQFMLAICTGLLVFRSLSPDS